MAFDENEISLKSNGGTELVKRALASRLPTELVDNFQIIPSRVRELEEDKIRVLWLHDLPGDPESEHLKNGGHEKFHAIVGVSNWQIHQYISYYKLPWSKCVVIENGIEPIQQELINKPTDKIKLIYHTTPHRGLEILVPVFEELCKTHDNIELDVYSSFKIYGWDQRDQQYEALFERCRNHPKINYHGTVSNDEVRKAVAEAHIFAYPSIWTETSCLSLMEAMSARCVCVHPNLGALYETASGATLMYQWSPVGHEHALGFHNALEMAIKSIDNPGTHYMTTFGRLCVDVRFSWDAIVPEWEGLLNSLLEMHPTPESRKLPSGPMFQYSVR